MYGPNCKATTTSEDFVITKYKALEYKNKYFGTKQDLMW